jgi:hypothetical protein
MPPSRTLTARIRAELARTKAFKAIGKRVEDVDVTGAAVEARALSCDLAGGYEEADRGRRPRRCGD